MKIKLVSDLHVDINKTMDFGFNNDTMDMLLIAGDIAGSYNKETKYLNKISTLNIPIVAICGNHLGYDYYNSLREEIDAKLYGIKKKNPIEGTKQWSIDYIKNNTPSNVVYLDNEYIDIDSYIIFGGCMYSDYNLYKSTFLCKQAGEQYLNDFRYVRIYDKTNNIVRPVNTDDYIEYHNIFMQKLKDCIDTTNKDIIVLTHFAPSSKSIHSKYIKGNTYINASYASDMDNFIISNPRIKYWLHGHMHDYFNYSINNCKVICNPFGYYTENNMSYSQYHGEDLNVQ